jgi:hypothetical protein
VTQFRDEKMVVIGRFLDVRQAEFALTILMGHDIDAFIDAPYTSSMFPNEILGSGGVGLFVRDSDAERAIAILTAAPEDVEEPEESH